LKQGVLGLIIQADRCNLPAFGEKYLDFSVILPAPFIRETIGVLPKIPQPANRASQITARHS
jgi:hypothetical protein